MNLGHRMFTSTSAFIWLKTNKKSLAPLENHYFSRPFLQISKNSPLFPIPFLHSIFRFEFFEHHSALTRSLERSCVCLKHDRCVEAPGVSPRERLLTRGGVNGPFNFWAWTKANGELGLFHPLQQSYITLLITGRGPILYFNEVFSAFVDEDDPTSSLISMGWCLEKRILKTWHVLLPRMRLDQVGPSENWTTTTTDDIYHCHNYRQKKN